MTARYALYFSPADQSALSRFGEAVLGRVAAEPRPASCSSSFHDTQRWRALTEKPAHYGFHATLKAPFELQPDYTEDQLLNTVAAFCDANFAQPLQTLAPRRLSHFLALTLSDQSAALTEFVQSVVARFEPFRQPLTPDDMQRRLAQDLSPHQEQLLRQFGYPYVADEFRFHMTLSGPLSQGDIDYEHWVDQLFNDTVTESSVLDHIAVFAQPDRHSAFIQKATFALRSLST